MNNKGVTGFNRKKKTLSMRVAVRNSAYAVNLTYDRHTPTYRQHIYTRKMVPITGRASASFSSMQKLKRIGNE